MVVKRLLPFNLILAVVFALVCFVCLPAEKAEASLVFHSGFENGNTFEWSSVTGAPASNSTIKNTGSYSLRCKTTAATAYVTPSGALNRMSFYLYILSLPTTNCSIVGTGGAGDLTLTTDGYLKSLGNFGTHGAIQLLPTTWSRISVSSNTSSSTAQVYVNGVLDYTDASTAIALGNLGVVTAATTELYFDDVAYSDTVLASDLGDIRVALSLPNAAGDLSQFDTPVGNTTAGYHYINVADAPGAVSDLDYNRHQADAAAIDLYGLQDSSTIGLTSTETIQAVRTLARMKRGTGSAGGGKAIQIKDNGASTNTSVSLGTGYTWNTRYDATLPNGGGSWTQTRFDALQAGANHGKGSIDAQDTYISAMMVMVAFYRVPGNPSSLASPAQTSVSVNLTWTKGTQSDNTTIRYKTGAYPDNVTDGSEGYRGTASSAQVTGLSASTTYYFRAWAYATPSGLYSTGTSDLTQATSSAGAEITNTPSDRAFGTVALSSTYWAFGGNTTTPSWPLTDSECYFTVTNTGVVAANITVHGHDWTGTGTGWTLAATPSTDTVRERVWKSGDASVADNVTVTTSTQVFIVNLAGGDHKHWELAIDTPTAVNDGNLKTGIITLSATEG